MATEAQDHPNRPTSPTLYAVRCTKYAKQTQFPKGQNERKLTINNEL